MAYSDFTFAKLKSIYSIQQDYQNLFADNLIIQPTQRLTEDITDGLQMQIMSEKAKSEFLIAPIIKEMQRKHPEITFFSGIAFNIEGDKLLTGTPDFMISAKPRRAEIESPIFCLLEAKNGIIEEGFAQCAAEMYAARLFNQQMGDPYETIYGAVTNAFDWVFLKLEGNTVYVDIDRYYLNQLPKLLGILQYIIDVAKK
jgi:hypothetical protein